MVIYAISDLEGFHPSELLPEYDGYDNIIKDHEVIICGDVLDSTMISEKDHLEKKIFNLRTIHQILFQPNLRLTFGNRDLNKLKVGPLTILKTKDNSSNILVDNFNNGLLNLDLATYNKFENLDWVHKMSNWYPFWGGINKENIGYWKDDNEPKETLGFFEKRFIKIFGPDTSKGTMSAGNLLKTIPKELRLYNESNNDYNAFIVLAVFKSMLLKPINPKEAIRKEFSTYTSPPTQNQFRGFLYKMFTDPKNNMIIHKCVCGNFFSKNHCECKDGTCKLCEDKENLYLFSHGGVTSEIIQENTLEKISQIFENESSLKLKEKLTDANQVLTGGYYHSMNPNRNLINVEDIINKIKLFNETMKTVIQKVLDEDYIKQKTPSNNMLLLLIASATFDCSSFETKIKATKESLCKDIGILNKKSDITSTMAGIKRLREKNVFFKNGTIYNIFGHNPNGFFPTIDLFENKSRTKKDDIINKTYLINLDTSNTFLTTSANKLKNEKVVIKDRKKSYLKIDGNNVSVNSNIYITVVNAEIAKDDNPFEYLENRKAVAAANAEKEAIEKRKAADQQTKQANTTDLERLAKANVIWVEAAEKAVVDAKKAAALEETILNQKIITFTLNTAQILKYESIQQPLEFNFTLEFKIDDNLNKKLKQIGENPKIFYHGVDSKNKLILLTYNRQGYSKCLIVLSEADFIRLYPQKGEKYLNKYLKYKQKYISLKKTT